MQPTTQPVAQSIPTFGQRLGGKLFDGLLLGGTVLAVNALAGSTAARVVGVAVAAVYDIVLISAFGRTLGKRLAGTRVVMFDRAGRPTIAAAIVRYVVFAAPLVALDLVARPLGIVWALVIAFTVLRPPLHRGVHDVAAKTIVVADA